MAYHLLSYLVVFLPIVIFVYQLVPQRYRFIVLLMADYVFFWLISGKLILYLLGTTLLTHYVGLWLERVDLKGEHDRKTAVIEKRKILAFGVLISLWVLILLKYTNFFGSILSDLANCFGIPWKFRGIQFLVPIGLSFYTLQVISYLTDVYRGTIKAESNLAKIALYLSFFPQIMEGPIARFSEIADDLYAGRAIHFQNLKFGYQRILWGLFKKIVIADRVYMTVANIFENYESMDGSVIFFGAICYTIQLYMEFSGCMDIVIGSGEIFGITMPENFRQPFLARNASEFWRRWHITLGTFFKDYIFYSVSLAKPVKNVARKVKKKWGRKVSKFVAPSIALFCVWICNGLWHGANWPFIFYGMYYFVLIFIENITEEPVMNLCSKLHINQKGRMYRIWQAIKLFVIVVIGEMFFRAETLKAGFQMFGMVVSKFHISEWWNSVYKLGMDVYDLIVVVLGLIVVCVVGAFREKGDNVREKVDKWHVVPRWLLWYLLIAAIVVLGAYGSGYTAVDLIYAGY